MADRFDVEAAAKYNLRQDFELTEGDRARLIAAWQAANGLEVDGKLGPRTQESLARASFHGPGPVPAVHHGDHGDPPLQLAPITIDVDGWAHGHDVSIIKSPRSSKLVTHDESGPAIVGVVWHWTATAPGTALNLARKISKMPAPGSRSASWHAVIPREGGLIQSVSFRRGSWHCGSESAQLFAWTDPIWDLTRGHGEGGNRLFAGIEIECLGEARQGHDGSWRAWPFDGDAPIADPATVVERDGKHYQDMTDAQEETARRLLVALVVEYDLLEMGRKCCSWGHVDIDPTRKSDPGPIWREVRLERILDSVFGPL